MEVEELRLALKVTTLILLASLILTALPLQICLCKSPSASIGAHHKVKRECCKGEDIRSAIITLAENEDGNFNALVRIFGPYTIKDNIKFNTNTLDPPGGTVGPI